jgi:hypothetical protein
VKDGQYPNQFHILTIQNQVWPPSVQQLNAAAFSGRPTQSRVLSNANDGFVEGIQEFFAEPMPLCFVPYHCLFPLSRSDIEIADGFHLAGLSSRKMGTY